MTADDLKVIAFYLPQFHPVAENDEWWGKGFTEWTNVTRARPLYKGHNQPQLPADLGFYDLRVPEVRRQQVDLARRYGIHGFCFYYYWFGGRRILERPLNEFAADRRLNFPFCVCWANESWSRRWDGLEKEVLLRQDHTPETDAAFIQDVLPLLADPRYIRVGGRPLLMVYRLGLMPDPKATAELWREAARQHGLPGLHLAAVESFGFTEPRAYGFDSAVEFPPHGLTGLRDARPDFDWHGEFTGTAWDYREVAQFSLNRPDPTYTLFRTTSPGWDNTARRGANATVMTHATPAEFEVWLAGAAEHTRRRHPPGDRLLFVNAWNEWAEGAHLEPDQRFGHGWLAAVRRVVDGVPSWRAAVDLLRRSPDLPADRRDQLLDQLTTALEGREKTVEYLRGLPTVQALKQLPEAVFVPAADRPDLRGLLLPGGTVKVESVNQHDGRAGVIPVGTDDVVLVKGWATYPGADHTTDLPLVLTLVHQKTRDCYFAGVTRRVARDEVGDVTGNKVGFSVLASLAEVPPGKYRLGLIQQDVASGQGFVSMLPGTVMVRPGVVPTTDDEADDRPVPAGKPHLKLHAA